MHGMLRNQILVQWTKCVSCLVLHSEFGSGSKVPGTPTNYQSLCSVEFSLPHFDGMCCCYPDSFWVTFDFFTLPSQTNASTMQHLGQRHEDIQWRTQWDSSGQTGQEQSKCFGRLSFDPAWRSNLYRHVMSLGEVKAFFTCLELLWKSTRMTPVSRRTCPVWPTCEGLQLGEAGCVAQRV